MTWARSDVAWTHVREEPAPRLVAVAHSTGALGGHVHLVEVHAGHIRVTPLTAGEALSLGRALVAAVTELGPVGVLGDDDPSSDDSLSSEG